jgi:hypothetical protein
MIIIRKEFTTANFNLIYECDCNEFKNNSSGTCKHIREFKEKEERDKRSNIDEIDINRRANS